MSAKVTSKLSNEAHLYYHNLPTSTRYSSTNNNNNNNMFSGEITAQPPNQVQTGIEISPPVAVKLMSESSGAGMFFFSTAALFDQDGALVPDALAGSMATGGNPDQTSPLTMDFEFPKLAIAKAGQYTLQIDIYSTAMPNSSSATLALQLKTNLFFVADA